MPGESRPTRTPPARISSKRVSAGLFSLTASVGSRRFITIAVLVFLALGFTWWIVTKAGWVTPLFLPPPEKVLARLQELGSSGKLLDDMLISIYRISLGFLISTAFALPIGILIGSYRAWEAMIEPLVDFIRYMPVVAFVPLTILWTGTGDAQKFLIIFIGTFFQQVLLVMDNVKSVPRDFINLGRTLQMPESRILTRIILPSAMPGIWDSMRISLGWAWTWLVVAELVAATSGLGYRITTAQRFFQTDTIFGYLLLLGMLGLATDQAMKWGSRRLFRYLRQSR
jgi:NitT/TauT family transport system permease protein